MLPAGPTTPPPPAATCWPLLDALGLSSVALAGHELGGWLGFRLALAAPQRFTGLVAVNAPHPCLPHRKLLPQMWRFWHTALPEYPLVRAWVIRHAAVLAWPLSRGPGLPAAESQALAGPMPGGKPHWQAVLHDISRRVLGGHPHQHLTVPATSTSRWPPCSWPGPRLRQLPPRPCRRRA
jgi:pimeloyl-ACP methyl ester carboxylesterase